MWLHTKDGRSDGGDMKRSELVGNVDAIIPQMRFADESVGKTDSVLPANRECCVVVWVDVVLD